MTNADDTLAPEPLIPTPSTTIGEDIKAALDAAVDDVRDKLSDEGKDVESEFDLGLAAIRTFLGNASGSADADVKAAAERLKTHLEAVL